MARGIVIGPEVERALQSAFRPEEKYLRDFLSARAVRRSWLFGRRLKDPASAGRILQIAWSDSGPLNGYLATPKGKPKGGVVLAHDIFGITEDVKCECDRLAECGYAVLAPNLYFPEVDNWPAQHSAPDVKISLDLARSALSKDRISRTLNVVQIAIDALRLGGDLDVHVLGYDFGGSIAWLSSGFCMGLSSAVSFYAPHVRVVSSQRVWCPVLLNLSRKDEYLPQDWLDDFVQRRSDVCVTTYNAAPGFASHRSATRVEGSASRATRKTIRWLGGGYKEFRNSRNDEQAVNLLLSRFFQVAASDAPVGPISLTALDDEKSSAFIKAWLGKSAFTNWGRTRAISNALQNQWYQKVDSDLVLLAADCQRQLFPEVKSITEGMNAPEKIGIWLRDRYPSMSGKAIEIVSKRLYSTMLRGLSA